MPSVTSRAAPRLARALDAPAGTPTMSRLDELPPDQHAALSLLVRQHKSYAQVAALLGISERAVHDRAHAALVMLAPQLARALAPDARLRVGDYLLRQQPVAERLRTRTQLSGSPPAHAYASELATQLAPLADAGLPEIPPPTAAARAASATGAAGAAAGPPPATPGGAVPQRVGDLRGASATAGAGAGGASAAAPPPAQPRSQRSSRAAGAVLLAVLAAVIVVVVVLLTSGGGSASNGNTTSTGTSTSASAKHTTTSTAKSPKVQNEIALRPPAHSRSKAIGVVGVLAENGKEVLLVDIQGLPPAKGFYYAIWLYNSPHSFLAVTKSSAVNSKHALEGLAVVPSGAGKYHRILLTRETSQTPAHPGTVVLSGAFSLH